MMQPAAKKTVHDGNLYITAEQQKDLMVILVALDTYFTPARNVIFERYVFGS